MYGLPGKKLLFMGGEFAQRDEWNHDAALQWDLFDVSPHRGMARWFANLNSFYRGEPALHELDCEPRGFAWVDANDSNLSVLSFLRMAERTTDIIVAVANFTPVPRKNYFVGVPRGGLWREILNSDALEHGGSGQGNLGGVEAVPVPYHGRPFALTLTLPPLGIVFLKSDADEH
jgi:1,4-alpha-glucan branching enzyme